MGRERYQAGLKSRLTSELGQDSRHMLLHCPLRYTQRHRDGTVLQPAAKQPQNFPFTLAERIEAYHALPYPRLNCIDTTAFRETRLVEGCQRPPLASVARRDDAAHLSAPPSTGTCRHD